MVIFAIGIILSIKADPVGEFCAEEGQNCTCDDGYVYFGSGSTWFTNAIKGNQSCSNYVFGDPVPAEVKECFCVKPQIHPVCATEGEYCSCEGTVWYGSGAYWIGGNGNQMCIASNYDDPLSVSRSTQMCLCVEQETKSHTCAIEGGYCSCNGTVSYGVGSTWVSAVGNQWCNNVYFVDPLPGVQKTCVCTNYESEVSVCAEVGQFCSCDQTVLFGEGENWVRGNGNVVCAPDYYNFEPLVDDNSCRCVVD